MRALLAILVLLVLSACELPTMPFQNGVGGEVELTGGGLSGGGGCYPDCPSIFSSDSTTHLSGG